MLSLILLAPPIGVVIGYGITGICISSGADWHVSFLGQGATMVFCFIVISIIPNKLINIDEVNALKRRELHKKMKLR